MQKLVTIYLNNEGYRVKGKRSPDQSHGFVEEHLEDYLTAGWEIKLITGTGGANNYGVVGCSAWAIVLLEKS
ncbi:MAG: hypothetical protein QNJ54_35200 [Prochloraceae cyanobacterium]|nr:hypothetical protein [Prochloraceae cyanobacterium]